MLYSDRKDLLDLYNAVGGRHYEDPELLEINTLENATFGMLSVYTCIQSDIMSAGKKIAGPGEQQ